MRLFFLMKESNDYICRETPKAVLMKIRLIHIFTVIFIWLLTFQISAQNQIIDSLEAVLKESRGKERAQILDRLSRQYENYDLKKGLRYALEMDLLSREIKDIELQQKAAVNLGYSYFFAGKYDSLLYYTDRILELSEKEKNPRALASRAQLLSELEYRKGNHQSGINYCREALRLYKGLNDTVRMGGVFGDIAQFYSETGDFDSAIDYSLRAVKIKEEMGDSLHIVAALGSLSNIYGAMDDVARKKETLLRMKAYLTNFQSSYYYYRVLDALSDVFKREEKYDSAMYYYDLNLSVTHTSGDKLRNAKTLANKGNLFTIMGECEKAVQTLRKSQLLMKDLDVPKYICHLDYNLAGAYLGMEQYDSANMLFNKAFNVASKINYATVIENALEGLYQLKKEQNDFRAALDYYEQMIAYTDSIRSENVQVRMAELETKYETAKKEKQIAQMEYEQKIIDKQSFIFRLAATAIAFILLLIIFAIWQKKRKDKQIHLQKELVLHKEKELADLELEKSKIKEQELQQNLMYKSKQLSSHALHMMQKNNMLHEISDELDTASDPDASMVKRIKFLINESLRSDKDWDVFKLYFEEINKGFFKKLKEINPDLTTNDLRLCALIKLNMNSKEMASVLNISPNSIKSARYRLKKKLDLDVDAGLESFVRETI